MKTSSLLVLSVTAFVLSSPVLMADPIPNPLIDYAGFEKVVLSSEKERESHRLTEDAFIAAMADPSVVVLDARTAMRYQMRHIKGAINLPFTEFAAGPLTSVIPDKDTKVLIYCNNNFLGDQVALLSKAATASLNLSTYTSLKSYGYTHIYELGPLLDVNKTKIPFEGTEVK
jgi:phage shock protein E